VASAPNTLARISAYRVRSGRGMADFIGVVFRAVEQERRKKLGPGTRAALTNLQRQSRRVPKAQAAKMAPIFGKLRQIAEKAGAPQVSAAIVPAAAWFWRNVEQPGRAAGVRVGRGPAAPSGSFQPSADSSGGGGGSDIASPPTGKLPVTQRTWFWPTVIGGSGLLVAVLILAMPGKGT